MTTGTPASPRNGSMTTEEQEQVIEIIGESIIKALESGFGASILNLQRCFLALVLMCIVVAIIVTAIISQKWSSVQALTKAQQLYNAQGALLDDAQLKIYRTQQTNDHVRNMIQSIIDKIETDGIGATGLLDDLRIMIVYEDQSEHETYHEMTEFGLVTKYRKKGPGS